MGRLASVFLDKRPDRLGHEIIRLGNLVGDRTVGSAFNLEVFNFAMSGRLHGVYEV